MGSSDSAQPGFRELFDHSGFVRLFAGSVVSLTGDSLTRVALPLYVYQITGQPIALGAMFALQRIPWVILAPIAGVLADRLNRRFLWMGSVLVEGVAVAGLLVAQELWQIFLLAVIAVIGRVLQAPVRRAALPDVVGQRLYSRALSLSIIALQTTNIAGAAAGGALVAVLGPSAAFALDTGTFIFNALIIATVNIPQPTPGGGGKWELSTDLKEGVQFILQKPALVFVSVTMALRGLTMIGILPLLPDYVEAVLGRGALEFGLLTAVASAGYALSSVVASRFERRLTPFRMLTWWSLLAGLTLIPFVAIRSLTVLLILMFISSIFYGAGNLVANVLVARLSPSEIRGRVTSVFGAMLFGSQTVSSLTMGYAAGLVGSSVAILAGSVGLVVAGTLLIRGTTSRVRGAVNAPPE